MTDLETVRAYERMIAREFAGVVVRPAVARGRLDEWLSLRAYNVPDDRLAEFMTYLLKRLPALAEAAGLPDAGIAPVSASATAAHFPEFLPASPAALAGERSSPHSGDAAAPVPQQTAADRIDRLLLGMEPQWRIVDQRWGPAAASPLPVQWLDGTTLLRSSCDVRRAVRFPWVAGWHRAAPDAFRPTVEAPGSRRSAPTQATMCQLQPYLIRFGVLTELRADLVVEMPPRRNRVEAVLSELAIEGAGT